MRIHVEHDGTVFEYETKPMPEGRFRALCGVAYALIGAAAAIVFFALFVGAVG